MIIFGGVLLAIGLISYFGRTGDVLGADPKVLGVVLIAVGAALAVAGAIRWRRRVASGEPRPVGNVFQRARALPRLLRTARRGDYEGLPKSRIALWLGAIVYLVSPVDVLPEFLPIIGFTDDAGLLVWLLTSVSAASGLFLRWERERKAVRTPRD
jgi:uncharacterized membrane protein YkvA (DUF1232 family)